MQLPGSAEQTEGGKPRGGSALAAAIAPFSSGTNCCEGGNCPGGPGNRGRRGQREVCGVRRPVQVLYNGKYCSAVKWISAIGKMDSDVPRGAGTVESDTTQLNVGSLLRDDKDATLCFGDVTFQCVTPCAQQASLLLQVIMLVDTPRRGFIVAEG